MVVQLDGIGSSIAKSISRFEKVDQLQGGHVIADVLAGLFQLFLLAFPKSFSSQPLCSLLGEVVHITHRSVQKVKVGLPTDRVTGWTPMPEAPMELVDDVGLGTVPVHGVAGVWHLVLVAPASHILDVVAHHDRLWTEKKFWPGGLLILYMICHHMPGNVTCNTTKLFCHVVSRFSVREVSLPCGAGAISSRFMAFVLAWPL